MWCGSQAESREKHQTESQAWPRRSYNGSRGLKSWVGAMGSIQLDTLVLRQPTSECVLGAPFPLAPDDTSLLDRLALGLEFACTLLILGT